jgi:hypothetical protein
MHHGRLALGLLLASVALAVPVLLLAPGSAGTDLLAQLDGLLVASAVVAVAVWAFDVLRRRHRSSRSSVPHETVVRTRPGRLAARTARRSSSVRRPTTPRPAPAPGGDGRDLVHVPVTRQRQG